MNLKLDKIFNLRSENRGYIIIEYHVTLLVVILKLNKLLDTFVLIANQGH